MDFRGVLFLGLVSGAGLVVFGSASCANVDPSEVTFEARPKNDIIGADAASGSSSGGGEGGTGEAGADAGGEAGGPITAFTGAMPYDATSAAATTGSGQQAGHNFGAAGMNPAGQTCFTCHNKTMPGGAPEFAIGGTIYSSQAGTTALTSHAEVRIVDSKGVFVAQAYSDELGNVWTDQITPNIPAGSSIGVRNGTTMKLMTTKLTGPADGNCNNSLCHGTGGAAGGPVFLQ